MNAAQAVHQHIAADGTLVIDGATGSELERRGAEVEPGAWCSMVSLTHPDILRAVHRDYIELGARLITTNTFSTNRNMMDPAGLGADVERANRASVRLAIEARDAAGRDDVVIAGSMSHQVPMDQARNRFIPPEAVAKANFEEMADILASAGAEILLLEMMSDPMLVNLAMSAALATGLPVWIGFSARLDAQDRPESYSMPGLSVETMLDSIDFDAAAVAGFMHSKANVISPALSLLRHRWDGPLMAYPDSGYFEKPHWQFVDIIPPEVFVAYCRDWHDAGVRVLGGCCGLGLSHIAALVEMFGTER